MRVLCALLVTASALGLLAVIEAEAASTAWACGDTVAVGSADDVFTGGAGSTACNAASPAHHDEATTNALPPGEWVTTVVCDASPAGGCTGQRACPDGTGMTQTYFATSDGRHLDTTNSCDEPVPQSQPASGPTPADIARAFEQVPLPESVLVIQPPGGATLVNFETNFYTEAAPFERTVTLLGHRVRFKISAQSFTWHFGDPNGHSDRTTSSPGAAYPHLEVTHRYLHKGTVAPSVDTTWAADYQLDGRPWTPVNGTVTRRGAAQRLTIRSATPLLAG